MPFFRSSARTKALSFFSILFPYVNVGFLQSDLPLHFYPASVVCLVLLHLCGLLYLVFLSSDLHAFPPLYLLLIVVFLSFSNVPIFSDRFAVTQMVFWHIHYNTYFKFWRVFPLFFRFSTHKKYAPPKCLTFGVHITDNAADIIVFLHHYCSARMRLISSAMSAAAIS